MISREIARSRATISRGIPLKVLTIIILIISCLACRNDSTNSSTPSTNDTSSLEKISLEYPVHINVEKVEKINDRHIYILIRDPEIPDTTYVLRVIDLK